MTECLLRKEGIAMDVRNCKQCGRLYNYIGGSYRSLCPDCITKIEEKFDEVKLYIDEHRAAAIHEVSQECDVSVKQIEQWVREERLCFADDSPIGIACECCGKTIKTGRYCDDCKNLLANQLGSVYGNPAAMPAEPSKKRGTPQARMRFLDK